MCSVHFSSDSNVVFVQISHKAQPPPPKNNWCIAWMAGALCIFSQHFYCLLAVRWQRSLLPQHLNKNPHQKCGSQIPAATRWSRSFPGPEASPSSGSQSIKLNNLTSTKKNPENFWLYWLSVGFQKLLTLKKISSSTKHEPQLKFYAALQRCLMLPTFSLQLQRKWGPWNWKKVRFHEWSTFESEVPFWLALAFTSLKKDPNVAWNSMGQMTTETTTAEENGLVSRLHNHLTLRQNIEESKM